MQPTKLPIETLTKAEHFWAFFNAIPEEKWCIKALTDPHGNHCAMGHLGDGNADAHVRLCGALGGFMINAINNGDDSRYQQATPRQRILAALRDKFGGTP